MKNDNEHEKMVSQYLLNKDSNLEPCFTDEVMREIKLLKETNSGGLFQKTIFPIFTIGIVACLLILINFLSFQDNNSMKSNSTISNHLNSPLVENDMIIIEDLMSIPKEFGNIEAFQSIHTYDLLTLLDS